jgi:hypothetical protein
MISILEHAHLNRFLHGPRLIRYGTVFLVLVLILAVMFGISFWNSMSRRENEVFIGVMAGQGSVDGILTFVDEVEDYVNLIIISDLNLTTNSTALYTILDSLDARGLYFIPFMSLLEYTNDPNFFQVARQRWGEHFLGVYTFDEPGGKQIDLAVHRPVDSAQNYSDAASKYVEAVSEEGLLRFANSFNMTGNFNIFTSDYALYWFDYSACYNVVFTQFGWNFSRQLHVALCRGAATAHNSEWGAILTWTFSQPPYLESADDLYKNMVLAYDNGAKYIVVFDFPTNVTEYGVLTQDHLDSMKRFWNYHKSTPQPEVYPAEVAYVLPEDYGYGFRGPSDKIWGLWGPDNLSASIWNDANHLLDNYGSKLDIIYENDEPGMKEGYNQLIFWNGTVLSKD